MVLTDFLRNLTTGNLATLAEQAREAPQFITGQTVSPQVAASTSFQQAATIFSNILSGQGLPLTSRELQVQQQSQSFTSAINELITVREQDISKINEAFRNLAIGQDVIQERTQSEFTPKNITESLKAGLSDIQSAIGVPGLIIGAVIVGIILLKR